MERRGAHAGQRAFRTHTSWYAYAAMFNSSDSWKPCTLPSSTAYQMCTISEGTYTCWLHTCCSATSADRVLSATSTGLNATTGPNSHVRPRPGQARWIIAHFSPCSFHFCQAVPTCPNGGAVRACAPCRLLLQNPIGSMGTKYQLPTTNHLQPATLNPIAQTNKLRQRRHHRYHHHEHQQTSTAETITPPPPLGQALPCPSTSARLTAVFPDFSDHAFHGQKCDFELGL